MAKTTWADVRKGDVVLLNGTPWLVTKAKKKGKRVDVGVRHPHKGEFQRAMPAKDRVKLEARVAPKAEKAGKLYAETQSQLGPALAQNRWATERERAKADRPRTPVPPVPPKLESATESWGVADKAERRLAKHLGATLVASSVEGREDEYWVPNVGPDTIAAHLLTFHGVTADGVSLDEARKTYSETEHTAADALRLAAYDQQVEVHTREHELMASGAIIPQTPHWHSNERPKP